MKNKARLKSNGIEFIMTKLGEPVFIKTGSTSAMNSIRPDDWSISQLRAIADCMEENPECGLFSDGSGHLCRK